MLDITFLPKKRAPTSIKAIIYHVNQENKEVAVEIAKAVMIKEHNIGYYDKIELTETRVL